MNNARKKLPQFATYFECKRTVLMAWTNPKLRPGQALANKYKLDPKLEAQIYEETSEQIVVQRVWNLCNH